MKVRDLLFLLAQCDPDDVVVIQSDPEGNSYGHAGALAKNGFMEAIQNQQGDFVVGLDSSHIVILVPFTVLDPEMP